MLLENPDKPRRRALSKRGRPLWMLIPGGVLMVVVIGIPLVLSVVFAMLGLDQFTLRAWASAPFVGLQNFVESVTDTPLLNSVWLSVSYSVIAMAISVPLGVAAALATQNAFRGRGLVRSIFLIPYVLPVFVVASVWRTMFQPGGAVDNVLGIFGIVPELWLNGPNAYITLVFVQIWASWPFIYMLALTGLQAVDNEVHEASAIDGVGWWRKLTAIIFPYLRGPVSLAILVGLLHNFNAFTLPYVLFGIPAPDAVNVLPVITYSMSFQSFRFGMSAAMAIVSLILVLIPLLIYLRAVGLDDDQRTDRKRESRAARTRVQANTKAATPAGDERKIEA